MLLDLLQISALLLLTHAHVLRVALVLPVPECSGHRLALVVIVINMSIARWRHKATHIGHGVVGQYVLVVANVRLSADVLGRGGAAMRATRFIVASEVAHVRWMFVLDMLFSSVDTVKELNETVQWM